MGTAHGRAWCVELIVLSWPLAAVAPREWQRAQGANPPRPTEICHGIEFLACKVE